MEAQRARDLAARDRQEKLDRAAARRHKHISTGNATTRALQMADSHDVAGAVTGGQVEASQQARSKCVV